MEVPETGQSQPLPKKGRLWALRGRSPATGSGSHLPGQKAAEGGGKREEGGREGGLRARLQGPGSWASGQQMCGAGAGVVGGGGRPGATLLCSWGLTESGPLREAVEGKVKGKRRGNQEQDQKLGL